MSQDGVGHYVNFEKAVGERGVKDTKTPAIVYVPGPMSMKAIFAQQRERFVSQSEKTETDKRSPEF